MFGQNSVTVLSRTAHYKLEQILPQDVFFPVAPLSSPNLAWYFPPTTYRTEAELRSAKTYIILIELVNAQWASDVASNPAKRQAVVEAVLHSEKTKTDGGYENAMSFQILNFPQANVERLTNFELVLTVPQMGNYAIPANTAELVTAVGIPASCLIDHHAVPHQTDLVNKLGVSSVEIIARTVRYTGTFFEASPLYKTEYHLLQPSTWTVQVEVVGDEWRSDVVTDPTKRQTLINNVFTSNRSPSEIGAVNSQGARISYANAFYQQTRSFPEAQVDRVSHNIVLVTIPHMPGYEIPVHGSEYISTTTIDASLVADGVAVGYEVGIRSLAINARSASYSGTFFGDGSFKTESDIRDGPYHWTIVVDLANEYWHPDLSSNATKRQLLVDSIIDSNKPATTSGYELAIMKQNEAFPPSKVVVGGATAAGNTKVTITLPQYPGYILPGGGSEFLKALHIPKDLTINQHADIIYSSGQTNLTLNARSVVYSGTFFAHAFKTEELITSTQIYTIVLDLLFDSWADDVATDGVKRQALVNAVLTSNRAKTLTGYENALEKQREGYLTNDVQLQTPTRVLLIIPQLAAYALPALGDETITSQNLPAICTKSAGDIIFHMNHHAVLIRARTLVYSGTFFGAAEKTDENIQSSQVYTVVLTLHADTWHPNIASDSTLRQGLMDLTFLSTRLKITVGYENALQAQLTAFPQQYVNRSDNYTVIITIPSLPGYTLPAAQSESLQAQVVTQEYVAGFTDVALQTGTRTLTISARTVTYSGSFFKCYDTQVTAGTCAFQTEEYLRASARTVVIDLWGDTWQPDVATNAVRRQTLIDSVFASDKNVSTHIGYHNALGAQLANFPQNRIVRMSNTRVTITIDAKATYDMPGLGNETIVSNIPAYAVMGSTDVKTTIGFLAVVLVGRTHKYEGTFFAGISEGTLTADDIAGTAVFTITITLSYEEWAVDVVSSGVKRQLLIDTVLASSKQQTDPGYDLALHHQTRNFPSDNIVRVSGTQVQITIPQYPTYYLATSTSELIESLALPNSLIQGQTDLSKNQKAGDSVVQINAAAATFSGTLFAVTNVTDDDIRSSEVWTVVVTLYGTQWPTDIATDAVKKQTLVGAILHSDKAKTDPGYSHAMAASIENYPSSAIIRVSPTVLRLEIPPLVAYAIAGYGSERITAQTLPSSVLTGSIDLSNQIGNTTVSITTRTAAFSGTWFTATSKTDEDIITPTQFTITIVLTLAEWEVDVVTNATKRQGLVQGLLTSNRGGGDAGYENGLHNAILNFPESNVTRYNHSWLSIGIGALPTYILPPLGSEVITAPNVPGIALNSETAIAALVPDASLTFTKPATTILSRTASYSGNFFSAGGDTDDTFRDPFLNKHIDITLSGGVEWALDVVTNAAKRQALVTAVLSSNKNDNATISGPGYDKAMAFQVLNFPQVR